MKILFNCLTTEKGGAERVIAVLANEFSGNNDVAILTLTNSDKDAYKLDSKIKRIRIDKTNYQYDNKIQKKMRRLSFARVFRLKKAIINEKPDVIISFLPEPSLRLMFLSRFSQKINKIPKIISIRNDPKKEYGNKILKGVVKKLYNDVDGMVYQTKDAEAFFKDLIKPKHQAIIQNPVDSSILVRPMKDEERNNKIVSVGRLEEQKNHELLIRAFANTIKEQEHDYMLEIYGEGSLRSYLQGLICELGVSKRVFLVGRVDKIIQELNKARIFVLSSHYEGMPNALIEAMAMGLPCISTDCPCGGPKSLIRDGENGILVENENEKALSVAIERLISNKRMREKLSKNALLVRKSNDDKIVIGQWQTFIDQVCRGKSEK